MPQGPFLTQNLATGTQNTLNITSGTLVKASGGFVATVSVLVAGSATGAVYDVATVGGAAAANEIAVIPNTVGTYAINFKTTKGIVVVPGTGQTLAISWS